MNYSDIVEALDKASSFDLHRISGAIERMLDDPIRIYKVRCQLRQGQSIAYFEARENRVVDATIVEFKRTRVVVRNTHDGRAWSIPYYSINVDAADVAIVRSGRQEGLDRQEVSVGDRVGFMAKDGRGECYGEIVRLNQKTVTLNCNGEKWRVSYSFLFKVVGPDLDLVLENDD